MQKRLRSNCPGHRVHRWHSWNRNPSLFMDFLPYRACPTLGCLFGLRGCLLGALGTGSREDRCGSRKQQHWEGLSKPARVRGVRPYTRTSLSCCSVTSGYALLLRDPGQGLLPGRRPGSGQELRQGCPSPCRSSPRSFGEDGTLRLAETPPPDPREQLLLSCV